MSALSDIRRRMENAAREAGRDPADVALVAVSKTQAWEAVAPVVAEGQRIFGEN
ncbi:MAG: YggS family pyridoxal phosphate-dependent enzyme, partial [Caulobacteraceae bacterium]